MNENENFSPLSPENEGAEPVPVNDTESPLEATAPVSDEIPAEEEISTTRSFLEDFEPLMTVSDSADNSVSEEKPAEDAFSHSDEKEPVETESHQDTAFNPYAPKENANPAFGTGASPVNGNSQVNPSYGNHFANGYQQQPYQQQPYQHPYQQNNYQPNGFTPYQQPPAPKGNKNGRIVAIAIVAVCVIIGCIALVSSFFGDDGKDTTNPDVSTSSTAEGQTAPSTSENIVVAPTQPITQEINSIWVAEKVRPVVVGVLAYQQGELAGEGSGVLMSEDLSKNCTYVVTCAHVINEPGCEFSILLLDGSLYDAEVVALDERTDIGVLKINRTGMNLAEFGDSSTLKIGEPIYAVGNPGGSEYFGSITNGIVSAIDRSINATYTMTCIQHNAAINPGNSGGALVNSAGQIIGINSSKIAKTDYEGMGFAVPSAIFKPVVEALIQHGYVPNRPELGIKYASVSDYQLYSIIVSIKGLPRESIIIAEIPEGSALSGTNAQVGDLIIAVNGIKMDSTNVLLDMIDTGAVGDTLTLTLCRVKDRSYETSTFDVTVQLVEDKGSITTTTQPATLPQQDEYYGNFSDFFEFFGW